MAQPSSPSQLCDREWHVIRGTKYHGTIVVEVAGEPDANGWIPVTFDGSCHWFVRLEDCFSTESLARAECRARRQPRRPRERQALYGDLAAVAMFNGLDAYGRTAKERGR